MAFDALAALIVLGLIVTIVMKRVVLRRHRSSIGPGAAGSVYDLLNQDKRHAIDIVAEERAEARDPEDAEGPPKSGS